MATTEYTPLAARLARVEAAVARLAGAMDGVADAVAARVADALADAQPLVVTKTQLYDAVRAAMAEEDEKASGPAAKKRKTTRGLAHVLDAVETPSALSLLDAITAPSPPASPTPLTVTPSPPPLTKQTKKKASRSAVPPAPVCPRPPMVTAIPPRPVLAIPSRPVMAIPPPKPQAPQQPRVVTPPASASAMTGGGRRYLWGNAWHHLPEDYEFPKESVEIMWRQWCCGVTEKAYRPLHEIQASDIASSNNRKRLSDLKFLMKFIEQHLQERGVWKDSPSEIEADQMLLAVRSAMPFAASTAKNGQKRELEDLKWHSAVTLLRNATKKARPE